MPSGIAQGTSGTVQLIVEDSRRAKKALDEAKLSYQETTGEEYQLPNKPGALAQYLDKLAAAFQTTYHGGIDAFVSKLVVAADLSITMSPSSASVVQGSNLTYNIGVFNQGPDGSDGDVLTDTIPVGATFVSFTNTNGICTVPAIGGQVHLSASDSIVCWPVTGGVPSPSRSKFRQLPAAL